MTDSTCSGGLTPETALVRHHGLCAELLMASEIRGAELEAERDEAQRREREAGEAWLRQWLKTDAVKDQWGQRLMGMLAGLDDLRRLNETACAEAAAGGWNAKLSEAKFEAAAGRYVRGLLESRANGEDAQG